MPALIPAATGPKEQLFIMVAQLGSCSSSWSLLSYLYKSNLCPATPDFDDWAVWFEKPFKNKLWMLRLVQSSAAFPGQKQPQLWCFLLLPLASSLLLHQEPYELYQLYIDCCTLLLCSEKGAALSSSVPAFSRVDLKKEWSGMWPGGERLA